MCIGVEYIEFRSVHFAVSLVRPDIVTVCMAKKPVMRKANDGVELVIYHPVSRPVWHQSWGSNGGLEAVAGIL